MAADRRSGLIVLAVVLAANFAAVTFQTRAARGIPFADPAIELLAGLQNAVSSVTGAVSRAGATLRGASALRTERDTLRERVARLEWELTLQRGLTHRARGFTVLDAAAFDDLGEPVAAEIVGLAASPLAGTVTVNRGSRHGIRDGSPVMAASGLVGRVVAVAATSSQVDLLAGTTMAVAVLTAEGRVHGLVRAGARPDGGSPVFRMDYVPLGDRVLVGEEVISSSLDGMFPKGLIVGRVARVSEGDGMLLDILIESAVRFETLERVFLLPPPPGQPAGPQ